MDDKAKALRNLRMALDAAELSVAALRRSIDALEQGVHPPPPSEVDLDLPGQMRGVVKSTTEEIVRGRFGRR